MNFKIASTTLFAPVFGLAVWAYVASSHAQTAAAPAAPPASTAGGSLIRIGFVSTERVLRDSKPAQEAQKKLDAEFSGRDKDIQNLGIRLKAASDKLDKDGPTMTETARTKAQRDLSDMDRELQRKQREFGEDLQRQRNEALQAVVERANKAIREIAQKEKYDVVLQEAVYANPSLDITEKVLKALADAK